MSWFNHVLPGTPPKTNMDFFPNFIRGDGSRCSSQLSFGKSRFLFRKLAGFAICPFLGHAFRDLKWRPACFCEMFLRGAWTYQPWLGIPAGEKWFESTRMCLRSWIGSRFVRRSWLNGYKERWPRNVTMVAFMMVVGWGFGFFQQIRTDEHFITFWFWEIWFVFYLQRWSWHLRFWMN